MFEYIALSWNDTTEARSAAAHRIGKALQSNPKWQPALLRPGLQVFVAGTRRNANVCHLLPSDRGVVVGRLFRRREFAIGSAELELEDQEVDRIVESSGQALVDDFWGRYVAFFAAPCGSSKVLRDPSGALPCHRLLHDGVGIAFSWLEGLLEALPELPVPSVSWEDLAAHVLLGRLGGATTVLDGIHQVPPGGLASIAGDDTQTRWLWSAVDVARAPIDEPVPVAALRLRHTVRLCARSWASCYDDILLRLSGGLDSAILLSCLTEDAVPARVTCLNYHSPGSDSDERPYARCAADHLGMPLIEKECDPGYALEAVLNVALTPTPETYVGRMSMAQMDARLAASLGTQAMFTGGGGDQLFFEHRCTWPAADYLRIKGMNRGFPRAVEDAARLGRVSVWTAAWRALVDGFGYRSDANELHTGWRPTLASDELRLDRPERPSHPALALARDLPPGKFQQVQQLLSPFGYYDPYLRQSAPELVNPLLSQPLMELCLALPLYLLTHGGRTRGLARHAFADDLPREIVTRRSKGGMEEHLRTVLHRNLAFARNLLLNGQLVGRGMLDRARLEAALSDRPTTLQAYVGEIHGFIALEAWLHRRSSLQSARRP